jgi:methionine sulfoxide reductase heme-binding subunit
MAVRLAKLLLFAASLGPLVYLVWGLATDGLGANPVEAVTHETGTWTLRFLVVTLAVTPLRRLTGWNALVRFRRMLGLFAFFYGCLHALTYVWLDQSFDAAAIARDVVKRPFITAGTLAFLLMVPLAITSTAGWIRRLGGRRWQQLHRLVYLSAIAGVVHYFWLVRLETNRPVRYAVVVGVLLAVRVWLAVREPLRRPIAEPGSKGQGAGTRQGPRYES